MVYEWIMECFWTHAVWNSTPEQTALLFEQTTVGENAIYNIETKTVQSINLSKNL